MPPSAGLVASCLITLLALVSSPGLARVEPHNFSGIQVIAEANQISVDEAQRQVQEAAVRYRMTSRTVVDQAVRELKASQTALQQQRLAAGRTDPSVTPASGGTGTQSLPPVTARGDIFQSAASTLGVPHGHVGMYSTTEMVVEAPGPGARSRYVSYSAVSIFKPAYIQHVLTTQVRRNAAADRAYRTLQFIRYNNTFYDNRHRSIQTIFDSNGVFLESYEVVNCSQLVWLAYREATGIDLDANGGLGVYPTDLTNSTLTLTYRTVT